MAAHDELEPPLVGHNGAGEFGVGVTAKFLQASLGLLGGGAGELLVLVAFHHRQQPLAGPAAPQPITNSGSVDSG